MEGRVSTHLMQSMPSGFDFQAFAGSMLDAVVLAGSDGHVTYVNAVAAAMFGYSPEELIGQQLTILMPERYREAHRRGMDRIRAGESTRFVGKVLELAGSRKDGAEFPIEFSLSSWRTAEGMVFSGIIRDVTELKQLEQRERAQHALTRLIADSRTLLEAVTRVMETICTSMDWDVGAMWIHDPRTDGLRCLQFWDSQPLRRSTFEKETLTLQLPRAEGLPGKVWADCAPVWLDDLAEHPNFVRAGAAQGLGLMTGFGFPIVGAGDKAVGVLEFFTEKRRNPDPRLLSMMASVGRQIGTILERSHAEEAVLSIVEQMQIGMLVFHLEDLKDDRSLRLISVNPSASEILKISADEMVGRTVDENFPNLREHGIPGIYSNVVREQASVQLDDVLYGDSRISKAVFSVKAFPLPNQCVGVAFENITKRKSAEQLIAAERRVLERIVEGTSLDFLIEEVATFSDAQTPGMVSSILLLSQDGASLEYAAAPNMPADFVIKTNFPALTDLHNPASLSVSLNDRIVIPSIATDERCLSIRESAVEHGLLACWSKPIITTAQEVVGTFSLFYREQRSPEPHELEVVEFAGRIVAIIIERRRSEDGVRRSEARFRALIQNSADAIHLTDAEGRITFRSPTSRRILGYDDDEILGRSGSWLVDPADADRLQAEFDRCLQTSAPVASTRRVRRKSGEWIWISGTMSNLLHDETVRSVVFNFRDVTEQHMAEQTLRESEERFNSFMKHAPLVAFIKDAKSRYLWVNAELEQRFNVRLWEMRGKTDYEIFDRESAEQSVANDRQVLAGGRPIDSSSTMTTADGVERSWLIIKFPLELSSGERNIGGVAIDVTERNALEQQLERSERISGLGRVAASIAHEINNVLMGILPFAEVVRRKAKDDESLQNASGHIIRSVERGRRITQEILAFTRAEDPVLRPFDCQSWLTEITPELQSLLGAGIALNVISPSSSFFMRGDPLQLHQVLTNLTLNARDAMNGAGTFTITVRVCSSRDELPFAVVARPEKFVYVTLEDTGAGIPPAVMGRIFEPLFTTKRNAGTGLGLAIAHQVISRHGGEIHVESTEGKGTTFHLMLPCAPRPEETKPSLPAGPGAPFKRVVLVEDEISVGEGLVALLEADNVAVRWVKSGAEAAAAIAAFKPDLLVLDVGLPDMNGFDLYRRIAGRFPTLPTIFSTGHGELALVEQFGDSPVAHLLKPYDYDALVQVMNHLVAEN